MIEKSEITIPELSGDAPRRVYVYLPDSYEDEPERRYPVLYMFDGHNVFFDEDATYGKSWGLGEYLDFTEAPLIVAAVECNHSPDNGRLSEYSPYDYRYKLFGAVHGRGRETMDWYVNEFKPWVDENFRTLPDRAHTFIAGSSMGGLMSLYAVLACNEVFSRAAALSPSLWVAPAQLGQLIRTAQAAPDTVIYLDYGERELNNHRRMRRLFSEATVRLMNRGFLVNSRLVPGGEHCEASWEQQIPFFMETLLYGLDDDGEA